MAATDEREEMLWGHTVHHQTDQPSPAGSPAAEVIFETCVSDLLLLLTPNPFLYFQVK